MGHQVEPPRPALISMVCSCGHKNSSTTVEPLRLLREVVSASYAIADSSVRMIRFSSSVA